MNIMAMPGLNKNPYPRVYEILSLFNTSLYLYIAQE